MIALLKVLFGKPKKPLADTRLIWNMRRNERGYVARWALCRNANGDLFIYFLHAFFDAPDGTADTEIWLDCHLNFHVSAETASLVPVNEPDYDYGYGLPGGLGWAHPDRTPKYFAPVVIDG